MTKCDEIVSQIIPLLAKANARQLDLILRIVQVILR